MAMQVSEKAARGAKSKTKPNCKTKMQAAKDQENPGEVTVKLEGQVKSDPEQLDEKTPDIRQFNGHDASVSADTTPKADDIAHMSHMQNKDVALRTTSNLRPPTRDLTPVGHRMMIGGPNSQAEGPPPNCLAPIGPRIPVMPMGGGGMPMGGGQMQVAAGGHFVQNQSPVFVFSTTMANVAAEAFERGQCESIIQFHKCHPDTQQFLQKYPLNCHPSMSMRPDGSMRQANMADGIPEPGGALANVAQWVQQQNANLQQLSSHSPNMNFGHAPDGANLRPNGRYGRVQQWGPPPGAHFVPSDMAGPQGYQMFGPQSGFPGEMTMVPGDMLHDPMSKDNLTPQQLQKREQNLANLRKIKEMLLPELQSNVESTGGVGSASMMGRHGNPDGSMSVDSWPPPLMHPNVGLQRPGMAMSPPDAMVGMNFMQRMGPGRPSFMGQGGVPPNWDAMTEQQREWWKLEQDFYMEKYQRQHMQMGMNMPPGGIGPNRPHMGFMNPMQQMHRMSGPMSPSFPGNSAPSPHCGPMGMASDSQAVMFSKQAEFGSMGPDQNFDHPGGMPRDGMFPFGDGQMPPGRFGNTGEPFNAVDFSHPIGQPGMVKMPPMYGPQKRRRSANALPEDDVYKRLLPAPSPQTFSYVNSIEGQELTITKQLNHAFQEQPGTQPPPTSSSPQTYAPPVKSRPSGGKKKKGQTKAADQKTKPQRTPPAADSFMCPSPAVPLSAAAAATSASCQSVPAASPVLQMPPSTSNSNAVINRASSADPSQNPAPTSMTGPLKSSMNITSPSLANLAKGIDNLSAQIQQNPFRTVQMQENESDVSDVSPAENSSHLPSLGGHGQMSQNLSQSGLLSMTNISSHSMPGCNASMQPMTPTNPLVSPPGSIRSTSHSVAPRQGSNNNNNNNSLMDPAGLTACSHQSPDMFPGEELGLEGSSRFGFPSSGSMSTGPSASQSTFAVMGSSPGTMSSPSGCRPANGGNLVTGNAKIQIQAQAPNTIQYLPSHLPSSGGQMGDGFVDFNPEKACMKGSLIPYGNIMDGGMHGAMMPGDVAQRRQMEMQMAQDHGTGPMHSQMRMDSNFAAMHGSRGAISRAGVPVAIGGGGGMIQDPASPMLGPGNMMQGMGNSMHHPRSPIMGSSGPMHDQASPIMGGGSMIGPGGHVMGDMLPMQGHMKPGMMPNGAEFGPMMMGPGGQAGDMPPDMVPMTMQRRSMHPDAMIVPMGGPEFGMPHHEPMMRMMPGCNMIGSEMGMMPMGGREQMISMRNAGMRPELMADKSRSNRSRQKVRAAEAEARMRGDAGAGMMGPDPGAGRVNQGMMAMELMGGMMRADMGSRPEMMSMSSVGPGGDRVGMRSDSGMMMARGNGMASDMAMMGSRVVAGGRVGMMDGPGMSPDSVAMFNYGPSRRVMPPDALDMCQSGMMPPGMNGSGMCPPGMKPMVMQSPAMGQSPGPGMAGDPGYNAHYQQFQQQMYTQSQSPTMGSVMMRGGGMPSGPPDMMGRPPYDIMGSGPSLSSGSGMGFGQSQPGLGPSGPM